MSRERTTLASEVRVAGRGLHTGDRVAAALRPAAPGTGRVFRAAGQDPIPATMDAVVGTTLATTLGNGRWSVSTVEHLLAAAYALEVDDLEVWVEGPELPILDGSAAPWVDALAQAGVARHGGSRTWLQPRIAISHQQDACRLTLEPDPLPGLQLRVSVDFAHPAIGRQPVSARVGPGAGSAGFRQVCGARTFGFAEEVDTLRQRGLARGGSLDNALVFGPDGPLNPEGLQTPDEPARHKLLDLVGDLALLGSYLQGRLTAERPGHAFTLAALRAVRPSLALCSAAPSAASRPVVDTPPSVGQG